MAAPELVESKDEDGFTPLHLAVIAGNMPLVTFLLANNADVKAVDNERHTVVHWATGEYVNRLRNSFWCSSSSIFNMFHSYANEIQP